jgi:hypothetical protein
MMQTVVQRILRSRFSDILVYLLMRGLFPEVIPLYDILDNGCTSRASMPGMLQQCHHYNLRFLDRRNPEEPGMVSILVGDIRFIGPL